MFMGTGSNVGKSTLVAGIARALTRRGLKVMPFKPQNMSNNAAVTTDGGEIGRAQAVQAMAARVPPSVHMNPVLLKPESETGAQVIVQGKRMGSLRAMDYGSRKAMLLPVVLDSFAKVSAGADIVLIEGAGSPAEINLRAGDIANMGFALAAEVPVALIGDIDRGGVIASLVGTHAVLEPEERALIRAFLINKFRGDVRLFDGGLDEITVRTGWPSLGVLPWFPEAQKLPAEDALDLVNRSSGSHGRLKIAVPVIARIANFDDLDPLAQEPDVELTLVPPGAPLPGDADVVILPGSKSTIGDLAFFRSQGWDADLQGHVRRGGKVLGLCGGYQMLGRTISDPDGVEGPAGSVAGLGLLAVETVLTGDKITLPVAALDLATGQSVSGYEIHLGRTSGPDCVRPMLDIDGRPEGAASADGRIAGTYVHGLFAADGFRAAWLAAFGRSSGLRYSESIEATLDALADHCEKHLDIDRIITIARSRGQ
ncbi:MAG: cobyric acid synthase [Methylocystis sp.]|nr:cobyric acid synthase [Methylocystis sp.]MCA3583980.1 cobyric acid synthase [Methylocystis sp.]MCA3588917.1 cobyric acid synthase [Methylocystis sp.]MCA3592525.1 cobyric acid synthase [Methylocystis sp.]